MHQTKCLYLPVNEKYLRYLTVAASAVSTERMWFQRNEQQSRNQVGMFQKIFVISLFPSKIFELINLFENLKKIMK